MPGKNIRSAALYAMAMLLAAQPAAAREGSQRLPQVDVTFGPAAMPVESAAREMSLLAGTGSGAAAARGRRREIGFSPLDIGLTFDLTSLSSRLQPVPGRRFDGHRVRQVGLTARLPVAGSVDLLMIGQFAYMTRSVHVASASTNKSTVMGLRSGIGVASQRWFATAQYETVGSKARSGPMHRMAEVLGGAPINREGVMLELGNRWDLSARRHVDLRLAGKAIRRSSHDMAITGDTGSRANRSAELRAVMAF